MFSIALGGAMMVKDLFPQLGDIIKVKKWGDLEATVVAIDLNNSLQITHLVGWKKDQAIPGHLHRGYRQTPSLKDRVIANYADYDTSTWLSSGEEVSVGNVATLPPTKSGGMHCAGPYCGVFNEYAQANQPDGSFLCYSCRSR